MHGCLLADDDGPYYWHVRTGTIQRDLPDPGPQEGPNMCSAASVRSFSLISDLSVSHSGIQSDDLHLPLILFSRCIHITQFYHSSFCNCSSGCYFLTSSISLAWSPVQHSLSVDATTEILLCLACLLYDWPASRKFNASLP